MNLNPSSLVLRCGAVLALLSLQPSLLLCQETFEPIPKQSAAQYHVDFARNFFASPEAEKAERVKLYDALKELDTLKGKVASSADNLQKAFQLYDNVRMRFYRHYAYLYLRYAVNTGDESSLTESSVLDAEVTTRTAFMRQELIQIDDHTLAALVAGNRHLRIYLPAIEVVQRYRPYTLSLKEEELLSTTAPLNTEWQSDLYEKLRASAHTNPTNGLDQKGREEAFKQDYAGSAAQRDLYAFGLMRLAAARDRLARVHHFADAPSEAYFGSYWSRAEVDNLLEGLAQHSSLYERYQRLRAEHVKKIMGYGDVNLWDLSARPQGTDVPRFTIDQASQKIRDALAPLGADYGRELAALLNPLNGRMDIVAGSHRKRGGFSLGFIGTDSVFFSGGFGGRYNDIRVLAHESTHAVHRQLMNRNGVLPAYAEGPHYLFESFAIFSELLLPDYLYHHETDPRLKQYYLEQFLEGKGTIMFSVAPEVAVEHAVYDGVRQGKIKGADDLDAITKRIYSRYSIWPEKYDELKAEWIYITLMYDDPFYDMNYVYGALLALKFYEMYTKDPKDFAPRYIALMRNGFDAPPEILLKRFLGVDLHDPHLLSDALKIIEEKVKLLEKSYQE
jgi:oligoendopeptidase F